MTEIRKEPEQNALSGQVMGVFDIAYINVTSGDAKAGGAATVAVDRIGLSPDLPMQRLETHHGYRRLSRKHIQLVPPRTSSDPVSTTETRPDGTFIFTKEQDPDLRASQKLAERQFLVRVFSPEAPARFGLVDTEEHPNQETQDLDLAA